MKCVRCHKEILGAKDFGRSVRTPSGMYDDICSDCSDQLRDMLSRHHQEATAWWNYKAQNEKP